MFVSNPIVPFIQSHTNSEITMLEWLQAQINANHHGADTKLLICKGDYTNEYFDLFTILNDAKLPPGDVFFNTLHKTECTVNYYAQRV